MLCFIGSVCAQDKATLKAENHALQCTTAGPYNAIPSTLLGIGSVCGLGTDLVGIHSLSLAARYRVAACSTTLSRGLEKINTARGHNCTPLFALSPIWEKEFLVPYMALSTADAFDIVCRLDRNDTFDDVPQDKKQKIATRLLLDKLQKQDFAGPLSSRASRVLGPISRHRVADILPHVKLVSRVSRPGLTVGVFRILCNGLCTAQRFHTEKHDHTCRIGCPNEPDSLTHYNECPRLCNIFISFWRHVAILLQRNHLPHDLITRVFLQSLQYGIVVLGFLDAFVYAHLKHRKDSENSGNFGDCMKGRIRFMTAITPAYAHAYQATCLAQHMPAVPRQNFRLPKLKARYPYLPDDRSLTSKRLLLQVQLRPRFTLQHIYSHAQNPGTNVQTMLPYSVHLVQCRITTYAIDLRPVLSLANLNLDESKVLSAWRFARQMPRPGIRARLLTRLREHMNTRGWPVPGCRKVSVPPEVPLDVAKRVFMENLFVLKQLNFPRWRWLSESTVFYHSSRRTCADECWTMIKDAKTFTPSDTEETRDTSLRGAPKDSRH